MAYIDSRIGSNIYNEYGTPDALKELAESLESSLSAPVRMMWSGLEPVRVTGHSNWRGVSREPGHYSVDIEDDTFRTKGITFYIKAWREQGEMDPRPANLHWFYGQTVSTDGLFDSYRRDYAEGVEQVSIEHYGYSAEQADAAGATVVPIDVSTNDEGVVPLPFAEVYAEGRCIIIGSMIYNLAYFGRINMEALSEAILAQHDPDVLAELYEKMSEESRLTFIEMMEDRGEASITEARTKCAEYGKQLAIAQETVVRAKGNLDSYGKQLEYLIEQSENDTLTDELINSEWNGIVGNVNVENFRAVKNGNHAILKVNTKHLWLTRPDNDRKLPLGKFAISMDFGENELRIFNKTMRQEQWDHPHVSDGVICAAEYQSAITQLLRERKLAQMTNMMFSILGTVTLEDMWGHSNIKLWERADDQLRLDHGWDAWSEGEEEHPLRLEEIAAEQEVAENE